MSNGLTGARRGGGGCGGKTKPEFAGAGGRGATLAEGGTLI